MTNTRWWKYISQVIGDSSYSEAAQKAGFDKSAFTRWKKGARADLDRAIIAATNAGARQVGIAQITGLSVATIRRITNG